MARDMFHEIIGLKNVVNIRYLFCSCGLASSKKLLGFHQILYFSFFCNFLQFWHLKHIFLKNINISKIMQLPSNTKKYYGNFFYLFFLKIELWTNPKCHRLGLVIPMPNYFFPSSCQTIVEPTTYCGNYNSTYLYLLLLLFSCNFIMTILNHVSYDDNMFKVRFEPLPFNHHFTWWQKM
jgi:hypothetical protein